MPLMPCLAFRVTLTNAIASPISAPTIKAMATPKTRLTGSLKVCACWVT